MRFALLALLVASPAIAGPKLLVMRAESSTDWESRVRVEKSVMELAKKVDRGVGLSDSTFKAMSDMIGCTGSISDCKEPVLDALAIDEVVVITIKPASAGQISVTVQRAGKRPALREATVVADKAAPERALSASVGPLFGADPPPTAAERSPQAAPAQAEATPAPPPQAATVPTLDSTSPEQPADVPPVRRSRAGIALVAGGAALVVTGLVLWNRASDLEDEIRDAPNRTPADVDHLLDLEARGDRYALWGNIAIVGGVVAAGVGGYLFWRSGRVTPLVSSHGGGVAVTWEVP